MPYYYDNLDVYRKEYNEMLLNKAATSECIVQDKYFTVTANKKCYKDARAFSLALKRICQQIFLHSEVNANR